MNYGHGGNIGLFAKQNFIDKSKIIDFSSNVNWFGPPDDLLMLIKNNVNQIVHYPEITNDTLISSLSKYYDISIENIVAGNGSAELLFLIVKILQVNHIYIVEPNFAEYKEAAIASNIEIKSITGKEENNFKISYKTLASEIPENSLLFISNPNNPVGYLHTKDEIIVLAEELSKKNSLLFVDEAFIDFVKPSVSSSIIKEIEENNNLIVLRSLTKILAIPGLRLGILAANKNIITRLKSVQPPWSVNYFAQLVGENIFTFSNFIENSLASIFSEKERVVKKLKIINTLKIFNGEANFILCKMLKEKTVFELQEFLIQKNIMIRNCSNYKGLDESYFRIAIRKSGENDLLLQSIVEFLSV